MSRRNDRRPSTAGRSTRAASSAERKPDSEQSGVKRLQSTAGNHAVVQLLGGNDVAAANALLPAPTVQRNEKFDTAVGDKALDVTGAPESMKLPPELQEGIEAAWAASFPEEKSLEQGGILVKTKDGKYVWKAGKGTSGA